MCFNMSTTVAIIHPPVATCHEEKSAIQPVYDRMNPADPMRYDERATTRRVSHRTNLPAPTDHDEPVATHRL